MNYLKQIGISFAVSALTLAAVYYAVPFEPLQILDENSEMLGATITTIQGSDKIKDSRAVINTNFANLNADKLENSVYYATTTHANITSLPSLSALGTITTGVWNGTTLSVSYGGTGSTTLMSNSVLLGNGTSGIKGVPAGTEDQVLTLVGGVPTWTSTVVDQTLNYNWTGWHDFAHIGMVSATATAITLLATSTAYMSVPSRGFVTDDSFTVFLSAMDLTGFSSVNVNSYMPTGVMNDNTDVIVVGSFKVPQGASSVKSIDVLFFNENRNTNLYLGFGTSHSLATASGTITIDSTVAARTTYTSGNANDTVISAISVPATAFDGLSVSAGGLFGFQMQRESNQAADTYNTAWRVFGIIIRFD